jgi:hypothetical protein
MRLLRFARNDDDFLTPSCFRPYNRAVTALQFSQLLFVIVFLLGFGAYADTKKATPSSTTSGQKPETVSGLTLVPITDQNQQTHIVHIPRQERSAKDIIFSHKVPEKLEDYASWVLEVRDPARELRYEGLYEGEMPKVLHWDGFFNDRSGVQINQKYFARLLLVTKEKKVFASPWTFFSTRPIGEYDGTKIGSNYLKLYVLPTVAINNVTLETKSYQQSLAPNIMGDLRLVKGDNSFGIKFEVTANVLVNYSAIVNPDSFFYSDFSIFYRYRVIGAPPHAPVLPISPLYDGGRAPPVGASAYGRPIDVEVGAKLFDTTIRGFANQPIDAELAQNATGMAATLDMDVALWLFRLYVNGEFGYSALKGSLTSIQFQASFTIDRFEYFSPGIQFKYLDLSGTPYGSSNQIDNKLSFLGVVFYFKL